jgi:hypothetical protein
MLSTWVKILPFFVVEWIIKKKCERVNFAEGWISANPFRAIVFSWIDPKYMKIYK